MNKYIFLLLFISNSLFSMKLEQSNSEHSTVDTLFNIHKKDVTLLTAIQQDGALSFSHYMQTEHPKLTGTDIQTLKHNLTTYWQEQIDEFKQENDFSQSEHIDECYHDDFYCSMVTLPSLGLVLIGGITTASLYVIASDPLYGTIALCSTAGSIGLICGLPRLIKYCCVTTQKQNAYNEQIDIKLMKTALKKMKQKV